MSPAMPRSRPRLCLGRVPGYAQVVSPAMPRSCPGVPPALTLWTISVNWPIRPHQLAHLTSTTISLRSFLRFFFKLSFLYIGTIALCIQLSFPHISSTSLSSSRPDLFRAFLYPFFRLCGRAHERRIVVTTYRHRRPPICYTEGPTSAV